MKRNTHLWQKTLVSMVVSSLLLGGCALPVEQTSSGVSMPSGWGERGDQVKISPEGVPNFAWWQRFGSTQLIEMVLLAQSGGYDVAAAAARVRQADARARMAGASLLPEVTGNVNASRDKDVGEPSTRSYTMGLSASYEVDIWGEKRASRLSAMASRDAAVFAHDAVLLTLMASTAQSYLRTVAWRERVAIARYNLTAAERVLGLVESRYRVGSASAQETAQQRTLVASLRQVLALRQQQEHQSLTTLAVLLGRPPQKLTVRAVSLSSMKAPTVESGLPTDLLTRRPDVAAAERRLAAADADVTVARAAMLPTVRLTASYGVGSDRVRDVLDNPIYNLAAGLVAPIFNNGRLAAGRDLSLARREELLADYRASIISSLGDVENALNALQGSAKQQEAHQEVLVHGREAVRLAESRYRSGSDTMQALLDTQRTLFQAQDLAVQLRLDNLLATIDLYKALGGGWRPKRMASSK